MLKHTSNGSALRMHAAVDLGEIHTTLAISLRVSVMS